MTVSPTARNDFENAVVPQSCVLLKRRDVVHQVVQDKIDGIHSRALRVTNELLLQVETMAQQRFQGKGRHSPPVFAP